MLEGAKILVGVEGARRVITKVLGLDGGPEDPSRGTTLGDRVRKGSHHRAQKVEVTSRNSGTRAWMFCTVMAWAC